MRLLICTLLSVCGWAGAQEFAAPSQTSDQSSLIAEHDNWLQLSQAVSDSAVKKISSPSTQPTQATTSEAYIPWKDRYGPAYPNNFWRSFDRDAKEFPSVVWDDTKATATNPVALIGLGLAAATGLALHQTDADDDIADHFTENGSQLNTFWDTVGDVGGNPGTHFAVAGAMYVFSLASGDTQTYEVSKTLLSALALNGLVTVGLKLIVHNESPNGDDFAWPSGHTSSSFTFATVMYEQYGPWVGVPMYAFASYVGYERIDARNHQFSDVISGALIGIAIGHAVNQHHKDRQTRILGMDVIPYVDPVREAVGVALIKAW